LGGYPNDLHGIREAQEDCLRRFGHRPSVIEDAAHAFGSEYHGVKIGTHGNYCVFSFQAIKHVTCGDGGALLCPGEHDSGRAQLLRWYGIDRTLSDNFRCEGDILEWGYKFHMNDISAAIGLANLSLLEDTLQKHRENAEFYRQELEGLRGVTLLNEDPRRRSAYWLFTIRAKNRDSLQRKLLEEGIMCGRVHERNDRCTCTRVFRDNHLPGTDQFHREMLCIPGGWWLKEVDRERVVQTIRRGW
jgi:dTDP-4-amino-4,6-dideoxygalactose transaminase